MERESWGRGERKGRIETEWRGRAGGGERGREGLKRSGEGELGEGREEGKD